MTCSVPCKAIAKLSDSLLVSYLNHASQVDFEQAPFWPAQSQLVMRDSDGLHFNLEDETRAGQLAGL